MSEIIFLLLTLFNGNIINVDQSLLDTFKPSEQITIELEGGKVIELEVADTVDKRTKGLSNRRSIDEDKGMLFVFDNDGHHGFWMKDMNFSIDILWLNSENEIVWLEESIGPETFPKVFTSPFMARYVIELKGGFIDDNDIKIGDRMIFN